MRVYGWKCKSCGVRFEYPTREVVPSCPTVNCYCSVVVRDYSTVQIGVSAFKPHFNHAVGAYVESSRQFDEQLKIHGESAGSVYTRIDPGEAPTPSSDTQILETQAKTIRDRNIDPASLY